MLEYELTLHHTGLTLWGDRAALERLYGFVGHVVDESHTIEDKEGFVLGLCYDLRKAFEGHRENRWRFEGTEDQCRIYGVKILWPVLLIQMSLLRRAMGSIPTNRHDQAVMYELEHVVESALRAATPATADDVLHASFRAGTASYTHIETLLDSRCYYFIKLPAKERQHLLAKLMETFDPVYQSLAEVGAILRPGIIPPNAFQGSRQEWPDFEW
ncbi:DUF6904 family protein [Chitinimonas sp. BJB300]|uniref:DUF6904 family protein n=1 Tax=Chitinimonas sp. BJB300 TaxID=1559339 RepID=UPI000C10E38B|nr:hypothetical protein [Chitinimonas sp. BJB300]PHV10018.1 hypothetical protein CSQ89_18460 [Chitinimonas sp. BJB300]